MRIMKILVWYLLGATIVAMAGCSGVEIRQITKQKPYVEGLRFYRPHPYLWVTRDGDKSEALRATIIWLPDKSQEYVARIAPGLGKVDAKITLENGWNLTSFNESREPETAAIMTALAGYLKLASPLLTGPNTKGVLRPGLYEFSFNPETGLIDGIKPVVQFEIE